MQNKEGCIKLVMGSELVRIRRMGTPIQTLSDIYKIENGPEREVARYYLDQGKEVIHEPFDIVVFRGKNALRGTKPDFEIFDPEDGSITIVEVTESDGNCPKGKQRDLVTMVFPFYKFEILRRPELIGLQQKNPQYRFLSERQILAA